MHQNSYNSHGWKHPRIGRGMFHDVRRRLPYYWSDIKDAWSYRTIACTIRIYFINILPAIAYTLDMYRRTGHFFGINEALFSSALAAMVFSIFSAQPLTIVGITGLISLFNYTIFDIIALHDPSIYPTFMCWTAIWAAIFHWIVAFCNLCDYMRYVTDFSAESFGMYVGIIYIRVEELVNGFGQGNAAGFMGCMVAILYFATVYGLERLGMTVRFLADYAYVIATIFWTGFSHIPGPLNDTPLSAIPTSLAFHPTQPRNWLLPFWELPLKWIFIALPFGFLVMLLFYYDHNVSSLTAQARRFPLKKPAGFHWDFFLLGCTAFVAGILGIPMPNGLVPQAPVHTDSLTTENEDNDNIVIEQRISHFIMGLAIIVTMTPPFLTVLHTIPAPIFGGVFLIVGWGSIESNGILRRTVFLITENRFLRDEELLLTIRKRKIILYLVCQILSVAACVGISQTIAAIAFPVLIIAMIPFRVWLIPRWFDQSELDVLDAFTADNEAVLGSLGGLLG
ncbi:hypothetical protein AWENTII_004380 [Aspergillus wentii]